MEPDYTPCDAIRQSLLARIPEAERESYDVKYWQRLEKSTRNQVQAFLTDYLTMHTERIPEAQALEEAFGAYWAESGMTAAQQLLQLRDFAGWYRLLLVGGTGDEVMEATVETLNCRGLTAARPFLMQALAQYGAMELSPEQLRGCFLAARDFLLRRGGENPFPTLYRTAREKGGDFVAAVEDILRKY